MQIGRARESWQIYHEALDIGNVRLLHGYSNLSMHVVLACEFLNIAFNV